MKAVRYFSNIFSGEVDLGIDLHPILKVIPSCVKEEHNKMLMDPVSMEEVRKVVLPPKRWCFHIASSERKDLNW